MNTFLPIYDEPFSEGDELVFTFKKPEQHKKFSTHNFITQIDNDGILHAKCTICNTVYYHSNQDIISCDEAHIKDVIE